MDPASREVARLTRRLGGVQSDAHEGREAVFLAMADQATLDVDGTLDAVEGMLEGDEEAVARVLDLLSLMLARWTCGAPDRASAAASPRRRRR